MKKLQFLPGTQRLAEPVSKITVKGTVEDRISQLQDKKRKMVQAAFGESKFLSRAARLTYEDLKYLFG